MKEIIVNAQWQGGADPDTFYGAKELIELYLDGQEYAELPVSTDKKGSAVKKNGIKGFDVLRGQMQAAYEQLAEDALDKLFTLGGGCDADVPGIVYLSEKYRGELTVLWLDAHGDLNTPDSSSSALFYGMPLRALMDDTCFGLLENRFPLDITRVIHVGGREFDDAEMAFIKGSGMTVCSVSDIRADDALLHAAAAKAGADHIYIHLDLDVLDPPDFPNTPLAVDNGLSCGEVYDILEAFADKLVGLGVYEYVPSGTKTPFMEKLIRFGSAL